MFPTTWGAYDLLHQGSITFAQIEHNGIRIDTDLLDKSIKQVEKRIDSLEKELRSDEVFSIWSRQFGNKTKLGGREQLAKVLFDHMGFSYPDVGLTKTKRYVTEDKVLSQIDHPFVVKYLKWDGLKKKILNTYLSGDKGIKKEVVDGYLHTFFNLHTARSYRSSSDHPNFQNLPVRDPEHGKLIRSLFIPRPGRYLVENDFKGIEVAISCCYHKDPTMISYVKDKTKDMHRDVAAQIFMLDMGKLPKDQYKIIRYVAKNQFVFPEFYGSYYKKCAKPLWESIRKHKLEAPDGIPMKKHLYSQGIKSLGDLDLKGKTKPGTFEHHLWEVERDFWDVRFPVYTQWKKDWYAQYLENLEYITLTGFRIAGLYDRNAVLNYPIQGSAFHCLLWTLIHMQRWLNKNKMKSLLIGQIHDSALGDVPQDELQDYLEKMKEIVTVDLPKAWPWIIVPLEIEAEVTPVDGNWHQKTEWKEKGGMWQQAA